MTRPAAELFGVTLSSDGKGGGLSILFRPETGTLRVGTTEAPFPIADLPAGEDVELRIFIDKYVVEVFANDRQAVAASHANYLNKPDFTAFTVGATHHSQEDRNLEAQAHQPRLPRSAEKPHLGTGHKMKTPAIALLIALLLASPAALHAAENKPAKPTKPNVLFLFSDDQRFDTIHALGNDYIRTPQLDRLRNPAPCSRRAYIMGGTSGAVCMPSRAMLMSGRTLFRIDNQLKGQATWPEKFGQAGYTTFITGKWHNGPESRPALFPARPCRLPRRHGQSVQTPAPGHRRRPQVR